MPTRRPSGKPFRRAFVATVTALALVCGVFMTVGYLQGPRLDSVSIDTAAAVAAPQQLRLFANHPLDPIEPEQVIITPAADFTVSVADATVAVQFDSPLAYGTEYRVVIGDVRSARMPQSGELEYAFTTPQPDLYLLTRGQPDDIIQRTALDDAARETVYSAPGIQDYAVVDFGLAVVRVGEQRTSTLELVEPARSIVEQVRLPEPVSLSDLDVSTTGEHIGFLLSSVPGGADQANFHSLYVMDLSTAGRDIAPVPVLGITGEQIRATGWKFIPGTTSLVALTIERDLLMVDVATGAVQPLGQGDAFVSLSPDGRTVVVTDSLGPIAVDLATAERTRISGSPLAGRTPFLGELVTLSGGGHIAKAVLPSDDSTRFATLLLRDDGATAEILYRTIEDGGSITTFDVSPNGQYVAVETVPSLAESVSDGYLIEPRSTSTTTLIIDVQSGQVVRSIEGFGLSWESSGSASDAG